MLSLPCTASEFPILGVKNAWLQGELQNALQINTIAKLIVEEKISYKDKMNCTLVWFLVHFYSFKNAAQSLVRPTHKS